MIEISVCAEAWATAFFKSFSLGDEKLLDYFDSLIKCNWVACRALDFPCPVIKAGNVTHGADERRLSRYSFNYRSYRVNEMVLLLKTPRLEMPLRANCCIS